MVPIWIWYDLSWLYRKPVTLDNTGNANDLTDYAVKVSVTYDPHMAADFSDIRFTDADGVTLLDHWTEMYTASTSAVFWVRVPNIAGSDETTIYMYYGNAGASDISDGLQTFGTYSFESWEYYNLGNLEGQTSSNTPDSWAEYGSNPVYSAGYYASVMRDGSLYRMYYSGGGGGFSSIGLATSADGLTWVDQGAVLSKGAGGAWDDDAVWCPIVWKEDSTYHMMYTASDGSLTKIGHAASSDGASWTKDPANPVFDGTGTWTLNHVEGWGVIKIGSTYYLWFNDYGGAGDRETGLATSADLVTWTPYQATSIFAGKRFCGDAFKYGDYYYFLTPVYTSGSDYSQIELYRCQDPYFLPENRELLRKIAINYGAGGSWNDVDQDTPSVLSDDITKSTFELTDEELWIYTAGYDGSDWKTGLVIETDIPAVLVERDPLIWTTSGGTSSVVSTPVKQGTKALAQPGGGKYTLSLFTAYPRISAVIALWMRRTTASTGHFDIYLYQQTGTLNAVIGLGGAGFFHYWDGAFHDTAVSFSADTWYLVTAEFDVATGKYNFVVYDESLSEIVRQDDINLNGAPTSIGQIGINGSGSFSGTGYADNLRIRRYSAPEPTAAPGSEEAYGNPWYYYLRQKMRRSM